MRKELLSVKTIVATGVCSALFVILSYFVNIPTPIPNTTIQVCYAFLALVSVVFGPVAGILTGFIGHTIKDMLTYGAWWSWIIASGVYGLVVGLGYYKLKVNEGIFEKKDMIVFNIYQVVASIAAWIVVAPILDILIYSEPADKVFVQLAVIAASNILITMILGTILVYIYASTRTKTNSLNKQ